MLDQKNKSVAKIGSELSLSKIYKNNEKQVKKPEKHNEKKKIRDNRRKWSI